MGMNKKHLYWIFQVSGWTLYASVNIFFMVIGKRTILAETLLSFIFLGMFFITSTHLFRFFIKKLGWIRFNVLKLVPRALTAILLLGMSYVLFEVTLIHLFNQFFIEDVFIGLLMNLFAAMILYTVWSMIYFLYQYIESYNQSLKYEAAMNEIELNKLKSQLNPHFIFNALNSIRALVDENPSKAKNAITKLSNIMRNSLLMDKNKIISFGEELQTVKDYLDLETIRFEERLKSELNVQPGSAEFPVPPLMIQTLVENGIKHGISKLKRGGEIRIETIVEDSSLVIRIRNSGQYENGLAPSGYGISNTIQRLKLIYGGAAYFHISNEDENFVLAEIRIPKTLQSI